jgi:hypothetical protein
MIESHLPLQDTRSEPVKTTLGRLLSPASSKRLRLLLCQEPFSLVLGDAPLLEILHLQGELAINDDMASLVSRGVRD